MSSDGTGGNQPPLGGQRPSEVGYQPSEVEAKWQGRWDERGTNAFTSDALQTAENRYYQLMMFPYPSAEGLHVGNIFAFTGADVHGRFQRLTGKQVFEPIGFDAFGIHSENFALKQGIHPMDLIPSNVANFTRQLRQIGGMFDWNHTPGLPRGQPGGLAARSAVASTFAATLELAREGRLKLRQSGPYGPIYLRAAKGVSAGAPGPRTRTRENDSS